jgi:hypothetical protein
MLDGNSAALRDHTQRQYFIDCVFARQEPVAREQLAREAREKIPATAVSLGDVWDELLRTERDPEIEAALTHDMDYQVGRLLRSVRDELLTQQREKYIEDHLEDRVWELENARG